MLDLQLVVASLNDWALAEDGKVDDTVKRAVCTGDSASLQGIAVAISELKNISKQLDEEADAAKTKSAYLLVKAKAVESSVIKWMKDAGVNELTFDGGSLNLRINGGNPSLIFTGNPIPSEWLIERIDSRPNVRKITEALRNGDILPFAHFGERGENLVIKRDPLE